MTQQLNYDAVPNLIRLIYDAAGDPRQWPEFLKEFGGEVKAKAVGLVVCDSKSGKAQVDESVNVDPARQESFVQYYSALCPWTSPAAAPLWIPGNIMEGREIISEERMLRTEFYNDFLRPQGWFSAMGGALTRNESIVGYITALRARSVPADFGRPLLATLMPHLQAAMRLHQRIFALEAAVSALGDSLDYLAGAVLITDLHARVLFMNRAAENLLARNCGLAIAPDGLRAIDPGQTDALREMISTAMAARDGAEGAPTPLAVSRPSSSRPLQLVIAPLPAQTAGTRGQPAAIVFISDPDEIHQPNLDLLQQAFSLTEAEARIAAALAQGKSIEEICVEFGTALDTVRTHIKRIFAKTGTHRQGELIRLLLSSWAVLRSNTTQL